ncbi:acetyl-CoA synthetase [Elstera cyanobacteriorum]|uniref:AMP-dependent synthetase n=1 Tax=Elstera cyanobacteriorum TaxID=2022747 RepID=A0A255XTV2_9PROT|nr:acyl-CoA synthetase [Elstera cyanobacteriorum]OYQ20437.1 AMP-dependent synthetase [Elstera cyanobacteriorum]GFZ99138.1 acetyl-CoA synthetase [Elstera cyanobacteriorum]
MAGVLPRLASYQAVYDAFRWSIPARFNIGVAVADAHVAAGDGLALLEVAADGDVREWRFSDLLRAASRLGNVLEAGGIGRGERVGVLLAQSPETAIAHIAAYRHGAIAVPLFGLFGPEALEFRLGNCAASALITDRAGYEKIAPLRAQLPALKLILVTDWGSGATPPGVLDWAAALGAAADTRAAVDTAADDPAVIIYTSGTTGQPKGALHAHRVLLGHLPGVEMPHHFFPEAGDRFWTPADWAWIGGLFDVLLPSLYHGIPVVAHRMSKFDPDAAFAFITRHGIRNLFLPPTALKLMRTSTATARSVRSIGSGGESLGGELLDWGRAAFGVTINEFYGQTECNLVVGNDDRLFPVKPGATGRAFPGHRVAVIGPDGQALPPGTPGTIAVHRPDPVMFLGYWNNPQATAAKFIGDWLLTGDQGAIDEEGYIHFVGRDDDVITSGGYRIGPGEIEDCLLKHPAVSLVAVVGKPDPVRTEIVKAFIVLKPGVAETPALTAELQDFVRQRLAAHEYPREIAFVPDLPMTATGKIIRKDLRARG